MPAIEDWMKLFRKSNPEIRRRAAAGLLLHGAELPFSVLLEILDHPLELAQWDKTREVLLARRDPELLAAMVSRLQSDLALVREIACDVLGELGDRSASLALVSVMTDPDWWVRRRAAYALLRLADPRTAGELARLAALPENQDFAWMLKMALEKLASQAAE